MKGISITEQEMPLYKECPKCNKMKHSWGLRNRVVTPVPRPLVNQDFLYCRSIGRRPYRYSMIHAPGPSKVVGRRLKRSSSRILRNVPKLTTKQIRAEEHYLFIMKC